MSVKATYRTRAYGKKVDGSFQRTRPAPTMQYEKALMADGAQYIAGIDEVGVGAWAGPVAVGVVVLKPGTRFYKVRDSKLLDAKRREWLAGRIREGSLSWSVAFSWPDEIDRVGLSLAIKMAALRAIEGLSCQPEAFLIDGNWNFLRWRPPLDERAPCLSSPTVSLKELPFSKTIVRGDTESVSIASASLVAKVARDQLMARLAPMYPFYRFELNKGYPSPVHKWALAAFGPCPIHRRLFAPVQRLVDEGTPGRLLPDLRASRPTGGLLT